MQFFSYLVDLIAATLAGTFAPYVFGRVQPVVLISATTVAVVIAFAVHIYPNLPHRVEPAWQEVSVDLDQFSPLPPKKFGNEWTKHVGWKDIFWLSKSRGWLVGGHGDVGIGIMLYSFGGPTWNLVPNENFESGEGEFTWGPTGTRGYRWDDVGPIYSTRFYLGPALERGVRVDGWAATATGIYRSSDSGQTWVRSSPAPDSPQRYAFFFNFAGVEGFSEIYATGWQGIAHWLPTTGWILEKPTY